jgi:uncharacterized membrane protein
LQITAPLAFLPLRRGYLLPALVPGAVLTLLTTGYGPTTDIAFQYSGHYTPYVFTASALALASYRGFQPARFRSVAIALAVGTFLCTKHWGAIPPAPGFKGGFYVISFAKPSAADRQKARDLAELAAMIPEQASFAVTEQELPHVSGRLKVMGLRDGPLGTDYVLYGVESGGYQHCAALLASGVYVEIAQRPGLRLLKKK